MAFKGIIDRIEGDYVLVEIEGQIREYPRSKFPKNLKEGDVVLINGDLIEIMQNETKKRLEKIKKIVDELWKD